ncbi:putative guanine nucleotide-exchange factor SED4 [Kluyveromyces marxianus DMKU3-1042]|uniref:Guanine nucleotide-exchange factor SEC12 n=1 Tax=Kluyveromyces marxianus (strain DMKU3-1042 / BCC 29191 / NBRC 104275) TaxID=1003335 RepID=W0T876_KLUMD|nr:putative guanine nucleotide-exchange factor SED4 [Kluyveromyces marxianus DMKU3-1042]BAO39797.1 putative guanine nucleotide-exchange factor SED4 [Kluyveromyces marxianus DMKU3-1042]
MGKDTESTIYNIGYPIYGAKFLNDSTLLVAGGGGEGNNGIPNKISALKIDFTKKKIVKRFRELSLDDKDDSPTTLDCSNNVILVGCNEGSEKIKSGQGNNHLRKYVYHNEHLKFVASIDLDGSTKPEDYTKLTCISSDASVAAIASSKVPTIIRIVNPANLRETYEVETGNDVKDLHFSPDGKVLSYITASTLEVMSVVTGNFIVRKTDFDSNWTMSKIRFIDQDNVIIAATLTKGTGIVLIKVSLKSGVAKVVKSKLITNKFKGATSLDVDPSGRLVAIAGNENSVVVVTLRNLRVVKFMKQVHSFAITRLVFSPDSKLLASVSAANTVHILKIPPTLATSQSLMESTMVFFTNAIIVAIVAALAYYGKEHNLHIKALHFAQTQYKKLTEKNDSSNYFVLHEYPEQTTLVGAVHTSHTPSLSYKETTISFSPEMTVGPHQTSADDFISYTTDSSIIDINTTLNQLSNEEDVSKDNTEQASSTILANSAEKSSEPSLSSSSTTSISTGKVKKEEKLIGSSSAAKDSAVKKASSSEESDQEDTVTLVVESAKKSTEIDLTPTPSQFNATDIEKREETVAHEVVSQKKTDDDKSSPDTENTINDDLANADEDIAPSSEPEEISEVVVDIPIERTLNLINEENTIATQPVNRSSKQEENLTKESNNNIEVETPIIRADSSSTSATKTSVETNDVENISTESSVVEASIVETTSVETTSVETTSVETTSVETTSVETTSVETSSEEPSAEESSTMKTTSVEHSTVETTNVQTSTVEASSSETSAMESSAEESSTVESSVEEASAVESKNLKSSTVESSVEDASALESKTLESSAVETTSTEASVVETSTTDTTSTMISEATSDILEKHAESVSPTVPVTDESFEVDEQIVTITEVVAHEIEAESSVTGQLLSGSVNSMISEMSEALTPSQEDITSIIIEDEYSLQSTTTQSPTNKITDSLESSEEDFIDSSASTLDLDASSTLEGDIEAETVTKTETETAKASEVYIQDEL